MIGEPEPQFSGRVLPTSLEVLRIYFFHHKKNSQTLKDAIKTVAQQLCEIWAKARIRTAEHKVLFVKLKLYWKDTEIFQRTRVMVGQHSR